MLKSVGKNLNNNIVFSAQPNKKGTDVPYSKDTILKNNFVTDLKINADKIENSITMYPARGLSGSKNSNFYEFLTTGIFPYVTGSLTLMAVFNLANKFFDNFSKQKANEVGRKMALGVIFYGIAKSLSKKLVTAPVKIATGVDVNMPYARVVYSQPESKNDTDIKRVEYHKVFESVEFPRWDLLYKDGTKGTPRNAYYDKIAKKMGLGTDLKDSDQEVKPKIKSVVTKTTAVERITQYLWAGLGVALAMQKPFGDFLTRTNLHFYTVNEFVNKNNDKTFTYKLSKTIKNMGKTAKDTGKSFWVALKKSAKEFYSPPKPEEGQKVLSAFEKHAGKAFLFATIATTLIGDIIACHVPHKPKSEQVEGKVIDKSRKYTVS